MWGSMYYTSVTSFGISEIFPNKEDVLKEKRPRKILVKF